jgi:aldose 1-epimerase
MRLDKKESILTRTKLNREFFGTRANGDTVEAITLTNANGMRVGIISYGAAIHSVYVPDAQGRFADVTTGYNTLDDYVTHSQYTGSTVGRVANRIAGARFTLDGKEYLVPANDAINSLHGGELGFDKVNWTITACDQEAMSVTLSHDSPDGDQGYPGNLSVTATYQLHTDNALSVRYQATTDAPTIVNLSNHAYWNLGGEGATYDAMDHLLMINAVHYLPVDASLIPTGERRRVAGTAFDFRMPKPIGKHIGDVADAQLGHGRGYDHNWVIDVAAARAPRLQAVLKDPRSGRTTALLSNQPGLQLYSGNFFNGSTTGKAGKSYQLGDAIALEPQMFPNAANQPDFASVRLNPGERYENSIIWRFGTTTGD